LGIALCKGRQGGIEEEESHETGVDKYQDSSLRSATRDGLAVQED